MFLPSCHIRATCMSLQIVRTVVPIALQSGDACRGKIESAACCLHIQPSNLFVILNALLTVFAHIIPSIMDEVNEHVLKTMQDLPTIRIIIDVPTEIMNPENYLESAFELVKPFTNSWEKYHGVRRIVVDVYPRHAYIVIDINNFSYDFKLAHLQTFPIPVHILRLSRKSKQWYFFRRQLEDRRVANDIAELHRCNGQNQPPFFADHIRGSVYLSPRTT